MPIYTLWQLARHLLGNPPIKLANDNTNDNTNNALWLCKSWKALNLSKTFVKI